MTLTTAVAAMVAAFSGATAWRRIRAWGQGGVALRRLGGRPRSPRRTPRWFQDAVRRTGLEADPRLLLDAWYGVVGVATLGAILTGGGPILAAIALTGPPLALLVARGRGARLRTRQLPIALDAVAASLRSGRSLTQSLDDAASMGGVLGAELSRLHHQACSGRPVGDVLDRWATGDSDASTRVAGASLALAARVGGAGADAVEAASASLRERLALDDEVGALSVQARLSAGVLTIAPLVFAFLLATLDRASATFLFSTATGWVCIVVGVTLDGLGAWWMQRIVRGAR